MTACVKLEVKIIHSRRPSPAKQVNAEATALCVEDLLQQCLTGTGAELLSAMHADCRIQASRNGWTKTYQRCSDLAIVVADVVRAVSTNRSDRPEPPLLTFSRRVLFHSSRQQTATVGRKRGTINALSIAVTRPKQHWRATDRYGRLSDKICQTDHGLRKPKPAQQYTARLGRDVHYYIHTPCNTNSTTPCHSQEDFLLRA